MSLLLHTFSHNLHPLNFQGRSLKGSSSEQSWRAGEKGRGGRESFKWLCRVPLCFYSQRKIIFTLGAINLSVSSRQPSTCLAYFGTCMPLSSLFLVNTYLSFCNTSVSCFSSCLSHCSLFIALCVFPQVLSYGS